MKALLRKSKIFNDKFLKSLCIDIKEITDKKIIIEKFNKFFIKVGSNPADKISPSGRNFESCLPDITTALSNKPLAEKEFKGAFLTLEENVNVIKIMYHELKISLINIFSQSLSTGIFPDKTKIAEGSPIFENGRKSVTLNYGPISVLLCFLERIMYNRIYSYLTENNILFNKQIRFRAGGST